MQTQLERPSFEQDINISGDHMVLVRDESESQGNKQTIANALSLIREINDPEPQKRLGGKKPEGTFLTGIGIEDLNAPKTREVAAITEREAEKKLNAKVPKTRDIFNSLPKISRPPPYKTGILDKKETAADNEV